jgi:hypothetical protein
MKNPPRRLTIAEMISKIVKGIPTGGTTTAVSTAKMEIIRVIFVSFGFCWVPDGHFQPPIWKISRSHEPRARALKVYSSSFSSSSFLEFNSKCHDTLSQL